MITRRDRIAVGVFVLASFGLLGLFLLYLWGFKASQTYKRYYVYTDSSVAGLSPSSTVKYLGVDTGKVEKMELDESKIPKVKLTLAVVEGTPVKKDTKAQLTPQGITGIQFVELIRGESDEDLKPESEIPFMNSKLTDIVAKIDRLSGALDSFFGANREKIETTLGHADEFLVTTTRSVAALSSRVEVLVDENRTSVRELLDRARAAVDDAGRVMAEVHDRHMVEDFSKTLGDARTALEDLDGAMKDVRVQLASAHLAETIADVRSTATNASDLLVSARGRVNDDLEETGRVLDELRRTVGSIRQLAHEVSARPALLLRDLDQPRRTVEDK